jgi:glycosyltransferase involved in cell wall biosynthesis
MGILDCIAANEEDYVRIAVRLGTDRAWRQEIKSRIEASRGVLYEDAGILRELEQFFVEAVKKASSSSNLTTHYSPLATRHSQPASLRSAARHSPLFIRSVMCSPPCNRVRILEPNKLLATIPGTRVQASDPKGLDLEVARPEHLLGGKNEQKVFIWQRAALAPVDGLRFQKSLLAKGYLLVAEMDDDPRHWPTYAKNIAFTLRSCHCVQTSTEPLAELLRTFNPEVAVFPNQLAELPPPRSYTDDGWVTLFFGAWGRENDWLPIMPALNRVLAAHPDHVRVKVIHDKSFWEALATKHKEWEPACAFERYLEVLRSCDIGLLPLTPTPMNTMKSDLKFLECAGHGVAVLASPTVYEVSIVDGTTGLIYRSVEEFEAKLTRLIEDRAWRQGLAVRAYEWVRDHRLLAQHYGERHEWYLRMCERLAELNEGLKGRVPELFR